MAKEKKKPVKKKPAEQPPVKPAKKAASKKTAPQAETPIIHPSGAEEGVGGLEGKTDSDIESEYVDLLCAAISTSEKGMNRICKAIQKENPDFPSVWSFLRMFRDNAGYAQQYARAKEEQADVLADQIIDISDDDSCDVAFKDDGTPYVNQENIQRAKLRVDSRKWIAARLKPKKYGDKVTNEMTGPNGGPIPVANLTADDLTDDQLAAIIAGNS